MMPYQNQTYYQNSNPAYQQYMQQYQQPNYQQNSYAQSNNPYVQNQGMVGTQMSLPNNLVGKFCDTYENITANDVPMTGQPAIFVKNDGTEIQTRSWTPSGTIQITTYKPITDNKTVETEKLSTNELESLRNDFTALNEVINGRFDKLEKAILGRTGRTKKEVSDEE